MRPENTYIILSSGKKNKKGFTIPFENLDFSEYLRNPIFLAMHDDTKPIGRLEDLRFSREGMPMMRPKWSQTPLGQEYRQKFIEGTMNAVSIGGACKLNSSGDIAESFILFETSFVSIPADGWANPIDSTDLLSNENSDTLSLDNVYSKETLSAINQKLSKDLIDKGYYYERLYFPLEKELVELNVEKLDSVIKDEIATKENVDYKKIAKDVSDNVILFFSKIVNSLSKEQDKENIDNTKQIKDNMSTKQKEDYSDIALNHIEDSTKVKNHELDHHYSEFVKHSEKHKHLNEKHANDALTEEEEEEMQHSLRCMEHHRKMYKNQRNKGMNYENEEMTRDHDHHMGYGSHEEEMEEKEKKHIGSKEDHYEHNSGSKHSDQKMSQREWNTKVLPKIPAGSHPKRQELMNEQKLSYAKNDTPKFDYSSYVKESTAKVLGFQENIYEILAKETGNANGNTDAAKNKLSRIIRYGSVGQRENIFESILNTQAGKAFSEKLNFQTIYDKANNKYGKKIPLRDYLADKENLYLKDLSTLNYSAYENMTRLNAANDFIQGPVNDKIAFSSLVFMNLYANNDYSSRMMVLPATETGRNIGVVYANFLYLPTITTTALQTTPQGIVTPATNHNYNDEAVGIQMYAHKADPFTIVNYDRSIVNYDIAGLRLENYLRALGQRYNDYNLYLIATSINNAGAIYPVTGTASNPNATIKLWPKLPSYSGSLKTISYSDITQLEAAIAAQNIIPEDQKPALCIDSWMAKGLQNDTTAETILTRYVEGDKIERLRVNNTEIVRRQYYYLYDTSTNLVLNPAALPTATTIQGGMILTPELNIIGISDVTVYSQYRPDLYGEMFSAEIKSGASVAYKDDAKGNFLVLPN